MLVVFMCEDIVFVDQKFVFWYYFCQLFVDCEVDFKGVEVVIVDVQEWGGEFEGVFSFFFVVNFDENVYVE